MLSPVFWFLFVAAFLLLRAAFDAGRLVDGIRVRRVRPVEEPERARAADVLRRAA